MKDDRWWSSRGHRRYCIVLVLAVAGASSLLPWCDEGQPSIWFSDPREEPAERVVE